jgi:hypothetical protein
MTEVLVKEQVAVQRDRFVSFKLLERIVEALERSSPRRAGVVPTEGPAAGGMEAVPVIERVWMPLFLMDSDLVDLPFALEANKDSKEDSGCGSEHEGTGHGNERGGDENEGRGDENEGCGDENEGHGDVNKGCGDENKGHGDENKSEDRESESEDRESGSEDRDAMVE